MNPSPLILVAFGWALLGLSVCGVAFTLMSAVLLNRFFRRGGTAVCELAAGGATILKPLHGEEAGLGRNLASFLALEAHEPLQVVFGVQRPDDPARLVAEAEIERRPGVDAAVCIDAQAHGRNAKVSNLINMLALAKHRLLIVSDSDIGAPAGYLQAVETALAAPGVGVVTCPYFGRAEGGFWSVVAAMGVSYQFLPNVTAGVSLGLANPCMGSTTAIKRETLERIGGLSAFRDALADDYAIGAAVRGLGLKSVTAPVLVSHSCVEESLGAVFRHEVRWAKTILGLDPAGHVGSVVAHPLPLALLGVLATGFSPPSLLIAAVAFAARVCLARVTDGAIGHRSGSWTLIPLRDMLSFSVFVGSFFVRSVEWRGSKFQVSPDGDLTPV